MSLLGILKKCNTAPEEAGKKGKTNAWSLATKAIKTHIENTLESIREKYPDFPGKAINDFASIKQPLVASFKQEYEDILAAEQKAELPNLKHIADVFQKEYTTAFGHLIDARIDVKQTEVKVGAQDKLVVAEDDSNLDNDKETKSILQGGKAPQKFKHEAPSIHAFFMGANPRLGKNSSILTSLIKSPIYDRNALRTVWELLEAAQKLPVRTTNHLPEMKLPEVEGLILDFKSENSTNHPSYEVYKGTICKYKLVMISSNNDEPKLGQFCIKTEANGSLTYKVITPQNTIVTDRIEKLELRRCIFQYVNAELEYKKFMDAFNSKNTIALEKYLPDFLKLTKRGHIHPVMEVAVKTFFPTAPAEYKADRDGSALLAECMGEHYIKVIGGSNAKQQIVYPLMYGSLKQVFWESQQLKKPLPRLTTLRMIYDVARGVQRMAAEHKKQKLYFKMQRDLKSTNVLVPHDWITDPRFSPPFNESEIDTLKPIVVLGDKGCPTTGSTAVARSDFTMLYNFPPGNETAEIDWDEKAAIFRLGMLAFEIWCQKLLDLFTDSDLASIIIKREEPKENSDTKGIYNKKWMSKPAEGGPPQMLRDLVQDCWNIEPKHRPSIDEIVNVLKECLKEELRLENANKKEQKAEPTDPGGNKTVPSFTP